MLSGPVSYNPMRGGARVTPVSKWRKGNGLRPRGRWRRTDWEAPPYDIRQRLRRSNIRIPLSASQTSPFGKGRQPIRLRRNHQLTSVCFAVTAGP